MYGLREIKEMNRAVADMPQTKREANYRVQRDRLGQVLRKVLAQNEGLRIFPDRKGPGHTNVAPGIDTAAEADARKVLTEIFGA